MASALTSAQNGSQSGGFSLSQLQQLWINAGGPAAVAPVAAAIGAAESTFGTALYGDVYPGQGATSFGIWQIHTRDQNGNPVQTPVGGGTYNEQQLATDPAYNAQAAVTAFKNAGNSFSPWSTYNPKNGNPPAYLAYLNDPSVGATGGISTPPILNKLLGISNALAIGPGSNASSAAPSAGASTSSAPPNLSLGGFGVGAILLLVGIVWLAGYEITTAGVAQAGAKHIVRKSGLDKILEGLS